ncbi:hypothetical protein HHK36_004472 [Tetracentron sinense]|uniref:AP2/ERF domain-containing protein n=1 Tax=Tetracentron sinense TaxID=13715 RepID=A0A834ZQ31_TETSI|nr:hypothetical protein HHK36_004472 [Tetracentron sinense]
MLNVNEEKISELEVEYEWKPQRCLMFGHLESKCAKVVRQVSKDNRLPDSLVAQGLAEITLHLLSQMHKQSLRMQWRIMMVLRRVRIYGWFHLWDEADEDLEAEASCANSVRDVHVKKRKNNSKKKSSKKGHGKNDQNLDDGGSSVRGPQWLSRRIWIFWDHMQIDVQVNRMSDQAIPCFVSWDGGVNSAAISAIYGSANEMMRWNLWADMVDYSRSLNSKPWLALGDFNLWACSRFLDTDIACEVKKVALCASVHHVWAERNSQIFKGSFSQLVCVITRVIQDTRLRFLNCRVETQDTEVIRDFFSSWDIDIPFVSRVPRFCCWRPLEEGVWCLNCDGSVRTSMVGMSCIFRDQLGSPIVTLAIGCLEDQVMVVELEAICHSMKEALMRGFSRLMVQSDSQLAINAINGIRGWPWNCLFCLDEIGRLRSLFEDVSFEFVYRECNRLADFLSTYCNVFTDVLFYPMNFPRILSRFVEEDARGFLETYTQLPKMNRSEEGNSSGGEKKYTGVRRRTWGKWVSEIRVPGTRDRLWLGSYANPESAAVAHDIALFCLRGPSLADHSLNFPMCLPAFLHADMSPRSIQKAASDAAMAIDTEFAAKLPEKKVIESGMVQGLDSQIWEDDLIIEEEASNISSIDDLEIYLW